MTQDLNSQLPEGMMEVWTVERVYDDGGEEGVLIDDLKHTEDEAKTECERRGPPWTYVRLVVPYGKVKP